MSTNPRGTVDVLDDIIADLRDYQALVDLLDGDDEAIYHGWPAESRNHPVAATVTVVYDGSTPHRGVTQRDYRVQVTVKGTYRWREQRDAEGVGGLPRLLEILDRVADRLDTADGIREVAQGGERGPFPQELEGDGNRLAVIGDWRLNGFESGVADADES